MSSRGSGSRSRGPSRGRAIHSGGRGRGGRGRGAPSVPKPVVDTLSGPLHSSDYITSAFSPPEHLKLKPSQYSNPKSALFNYTVDEKPEFLFEEGILESKKIVRASTIIQVRNVEFRAVGDANTRKEAEKLAALSACLQLATLGEFSEKSKAEDITHATLSDGKQVSFDTAKIFIKYYCRRFGYSNPVIKSEEGREKKRQVWKSSLSVNDHTVGLGSGSSKKKAEQNCYLDAVEYLERSDRSLWVGFEGDSRSKEHNMAPAVFFSISGQLKNELRQCNEAIEETTLYANSRRITSTTASVSIPNVHSKQSPYTSQARTNGGNRSLALKESLEQYERDPLHATMRESRKSLPVSSRVEEVIEQLQKEDVSILMAATGSGKTTQLPQIIMDDWIKRGEGSKCNIICTQPRRIAAISVAHRVAKERGETIGNTVGYQVRFEAKLPQPHGNITFCTTGIFLKRMQSALQTVGGGGGKMDNVTHIIVDEVHERDIDTDLVLVVLKRLLEDRRARGIPLKIVLASATIDPTLFQGYFAKRDGSPATVIDIPGRSFPVEKRYLDDFLSDLKTQAGTGSGWVFSEKSVLDYIMREVGPSKGLTNTGPSRPSTPSSAIGLDASHPEVELDVPLPLVALTIAHVLSKSADGHVLVFLPGWDEITTVQRILLDSKRPLLNMNFNDASRYSIHLLHSTIPIEEQQAVFEPAEPGVRRIILATNIAETSITIPDVVYVVDSAKIKEKRYDPQRHISSLVSAWVGRSNINQRAGRAGRHRSGEYYGVLSRAREESLETHQMVEMKRSDLSNVVMHVKALDFPGMLVEEVLAGLIEPPAPDRVSAAMTNLLMVGALDEHKNLTSLGRLLQQLPVDVHVGRLVLYGSFFKCLDQALTLAALLTNRDPFVAPIALKKEALAAKESFTPTDFKSDTLASLNAYNEWEKLQQQRSSHSAVNKFVMDSFLSRLTLLSIQKIKGHLLQSLQHVGVLDVSAGGQIPEARGRIPTSPPQLNTHAESMPLLAGLIATACQPNFAVRTSTQSYRTAQDHAAYMHSRSVNHRKRESKQDESALYHEKQLYTFQEKSQSATLPNSRPQTMLKNVTRIDLLTYMLFGAYNLTSTSTGLECDDWLPMHGHVDALYEVKRLKTVMEGCMLRVFEGICCMKVENQSRSRHRAGLYTAPAARANPLDDWEETGYDLDDRHGATPLSKKEIQELDLMTDKVVNLLNGYREERNGTQSAVNSRPVTPSVHGGTPNYSPHMGGLLRLPSLMGVARPGSGYSTPFHLSRPATPSGLAQMSGPYDRGF